MIDTEHSPGLALSLARFSRYKVRGIASHQSPQKRPHDPYLIARIANYSVLPIISSTRP
jgi:hypothetical protein